MQLAVLGIDIGKTWFHIVGMDSAGKPVLREKLNRQKLMGNSPIFSCSQKWRN